MLSTKYLVALFLIVSYCCNQNGFVEAAPRPPPSSHKSSIPGASENEIEENVNDIHDDDKVDKEIDDLGLEYGRYLQEIVKALDDDPVFSKKLENVTHEQIMNGHVARIIDQVAPDVRNRLDELKRVELERLRKLAMKEHKLEEEMAKNNGAYDDDGNDLESGRRWRTANKRKEIKVLDDENAAHIDHNNPHTFEAEDLQRLILQATKDLDELDKKRRRDFKQYEMEKELSYRESLQNMTAEQKAETEKKREEIKKKHLEHPKVHHPGSKQQLEEVWTEQDHMPKQEFDPKIFFQMHDINGDGFLDQEEVESILTVEVKKLYNEKDASYDRNEMMEEYHRMREHIYREIDTNHDGLISKKEFLDYTKQEEFNRDEGWKGIEEAPVYTEEELKRYEHERRQLQEHYARYGAYGYQPPHQPGMQEYAYQPVYYQQQQGYHPQQGGPHQQQQQHQVYVVNAPPEHIKQPVQYQHVQLPPQHYQHQVNIPQQQQQHPVQMQHQQQQVPVLHQQPQQHQIGVQQQQHQMSNQIIPQHQQPIQQPMPNQQHPSMQQPQPQQQVHPNQYGQPPVGMQQQQQQQQPAHPQQGQPQQQPPQHHAPPPLTH